MATTGARESLKGPAFTLGLAGALPFIALAMAAWTAAPERVAVFERWIVAYGAVILAFVGALHWGLALRADAAVARPWAVLGWGVAPALAGWVALVMPPPAALVLLIAAFAAHLAMDRKRAAALGAADWYLRLRGALTALVCASLTAVWLA